MLVTAGWSPSGIWRYTLLYDYDYAATGYILGCGFNYVSIVLTILKTNSAFLQERLFIFARDVVYFAFQPICQTFLVVVFAIVYPL